MNVFYIQQINSELRHVVFCCFFFGGGGGGGGEGKSLSGVRIDGREIRGSYELVVVCDDGMGGFDQTKWYPPPFFF